MPISSSCERESLTEKRLARAQREALALSSKRAGPRQGFRIPSQNRRGNPKSPPVKYKAGKMKRVALVYRELKRSAKILQKNAERILSHFGLWRLRFELCTRYDGISVEQTSNVSDRA
jgi:hypothetical protein